MRFLAILLFIGLLLNPGLSHSAFKSSAAGGETMPKAELEDDIALPLPYEGEMIFRPVFVSTNALLRDKSFPMGISNLQDQDRQIFERQFTGYISAPFTRQDLPSSWKLRERNQGSWYFMGKYEVTRGQWRQIMDGLDANGDKNPDYRQEAMENAMLPVTNVSWPEVQVFLQKYNSWLIKNEAGKLPRFRETRNVGFLRLPTEAEWEYAARGGDKVPREWLEEEDFHPFAEGDALQDYAVYREPRNLGAPLPVGSRKANPLKIHDMAGNVGEMVNGFFHMTIADMEDDRIVRRLHGGAGGLIAKGGNYGSSAQEVLPGAREEVPIYSVKGAEKIGNLGFRLVIAGVNLQGGSRLLELKKENGMEANLNGGEQKGVEIGEGMTPREMVAALSQNASGKLKEDLGKISAKLDDQAVAEKSRVLKNMETTYRSLLYQAETLRAMSYRYLIAKQELDNTRGHLKQNLTKEVKAQVQALLAEAQRDANELYQSLVMGANFYKTILATLYTQSPEELARLGQQSLSEYSGEGIFNTHMRQNVESLAKNLDIARKKGLNALQVRGILQSILPKSQFDSLPLQGRG